jgi:hypothetical protein
MSVVFRSKIDGGFAVLALATPCVAIVAVLTARRGNHLLWVPVIMVLAVAVLVCWILVATYYELGAKELVVHCGPFVWRVPLAEVTDIRESTTARSGPALSMDRVEVVYGGDRVLILSPADKIRFIATVSSRAAALASRKAEPVGTP